MKSLPFLLLAALVAFVVLPVSFETGVSLLFVTGLAAVGVTDYTRLRRRSTLRFAPAVRVATAVPPSVLRLAA